MKIFTPTKAKMHKSNFKEVVKIMQVLPNGQSNAITVMNWDLHYTQWYDKDGNHIYTEVVKFNEDSSILCNQYYLTDYGKSLKEKVA